MFPAGIFKRACGVSICKSHWDSGSDFDFWILEGPSEAPTSGFHRGKSSQQWKRLIRRYVAGKAILWGYQEGVSVAKRFSFPGQLSVQTDFASHLLAHGLVLLRTSSCQVCKCRSHREFPLEPEPEEDEHKQVISETGECQHCHSRNCSCSPPLQSPPGPSPLLWTPMGDVAVISSESGSIMSTWKRARVE